MTREDILEAAAQVFRQKGFHGASMQDIAKAVNLQKPSLYHHVSSKQEILLALQSFELRNQPAPLGFERGQLLELRRKVAAARGEALLHELHIVADVRGI